MTYNPPKKIEKFEYKITELEGIYKDASSELIKLLLSADLENLSNADMQKLEKLMNQVLSKADNKAKDWTKEAITTSYTEGQALALVTLGFEKAMEKARKAIEFKRLDRQGIVQIANVTYNDLLLMTNNTRQRVKDVLSKIVLENMRGKEIGVNSKELSKKIIKDLREQLLKESDFAIIDRANKRWSIESYSRMIARTKMSQAQIDGTVNESLRRESFYGVISSHGSKHASCRKWEGKIVRLSDSAPGDFPLLSDLRAYDFRDIFHPLCRHFVYPVRDVSFLPEPIRKDNNL